MPWLETDPMNERKRFILEATGGLFSHTELCLRHGVSRKTGYKWIERYESEGPDGLGDRPHRVRAHPHTTEPHVVEAALELRGQRRRVKSRVVCKSERKLLDASVRLPWRPPWVREA